MPTIYYVYRYNRDDGTPYYIGKGSNYRAWEKHGRISVPKDNTKIIIIRENMIESDAFSLEIELIAKYGRKDNNTGILRNMTDGGDGVSGLIHSEISKSKMNISAKNHYNEHPMSSERKELLSISVKKYYSDNPKSKNKLSTILKKRYETLESREIHSAIMKKYYSEKPKKPSTKETKENISRGMKKYYLKKPNCG
jgi:hypothetical protein